MIIYLSGLNRSRKMREVSQTLQHPVRTNFLVSFYDLQISQSCNRAFKRMMKTVRRKK